MIPLIARTRIDTGPNLSQKSPVEIPTIERRVVSAGVRLRATPQAIGSEVGMSAERLTGDVLAPRPLGPSTTRNSQSDEKTGVHEIPEDIFWKTTEH